MYNGVFALILTLIVGYLTSYLLVKLGKVEQKELDPKLFVPPVARMLEKSRPKALNLTNLSGSDESLKNGTKKDRKY